MKSIVLLLVIIFYPIVILSQTEVTDSILAKLKADIKIEAENLRKELEKEEYMTDSYKSMFIDFQIDTFKIETLFERRLELDYTTYGMTTASFDLERDYDMLLNKYYKLLLGKLNKTDQELLKKSQRNWIQYRDSERQLNFEISKEEYSGGGTIQQIIVAEYYLSITKKRVIELSDYLLRFF